MQNGLKKNVYCRQKEANPYSPNGLRHFYCCLFTVSLSVTVFKLTNPPNSNKPLLRQWWWLAE